MAKSTTDQDDYERQLDPFFIATGRAIREWAELEIYLLFSFNWLLQADSFRARVVWMSMPNLQARLQLMKRLAQTYVDEPALSTFLALSERVRKMSRNRNLLAHNHGGMDIKTNMVQFIADTEDEKHGINFIGGVNIHLNNLKNWEKDIQNLRNDFGMLRETLHACTHAASKMHRAQKPPADNPTKNNQKVLQILYSNQPFTPSHWAFKSMTLNIDKIHYAFGSYLSSE